MSAPHQHPQPLPHPQPLALTQTQLDIVMRHARMLPVELRSRYLAAIADQLLGIALLTDDHVTTTAINVHARMRGSR